MPTAQDYLSAIQQYAPYIKVDQPLMDELNRVSGQGLSTNDVVKNAVVGGGYADNLTAGAQDYLSKQYQPTLDQAQQAADYQTNQAETAADRLNKQLTYLYQQRQQNDPLSREGVVSGAAQNYNTDQQAQQLSYVGQDLQNQLNNIGQQLANAKNAVGSQISTGTTDLLGNTRNAAAIGLVTPANQTFQVGNNTYAGTNGGLAAANILSSPLAYQLASNPGTLPVLSSILGQYGINLVDDVHGTQPGSAGISPSAPPAPMAPTPSANPQSAPASASSSGGNDDLSKYVTEFLQQPNLPQGVTESYLLPAIMKQYGLSQQQAAGLVYPLRKQLLGY